MTIGSYFFIGPAAGCGAPLFLTDKAAPAISLNRLDIGLLLNDGKRDGWLKNDYHPLTGF